MRRAGGFAAAILALSGATPAVAQRPVPQEAGRFFAALGRGEPGPMDISVPPLPGAETIRPGQTYETWEPTALDYLEALKGSGPVPPGPGNFPVRFADGRPNAHVTPERFRHYLAGCRQANQHIGPSTGLVVHWTYTGRDALGRDMVLALGGYGSHITEGRVWVGWRPEHLPDDARLW